MRLIPSITTHSRLTPQKYSLKARFFWFEIDLSKELPKSPFISLNKFNLYSLLDRHYFQIGGKNIKENVELLLIQNGVAVKTQKVLLYTNLSFLGYVFNPVSFFLIELEDNSHCAIIQICNTFSELKTYFVPQNKCTEEGFDFTTDKLFYISPYSAPDNYMRFKFLKNSSNLSITVYDYLADSTLELVATMKGSFSDFSNYKLIQTTLKFPFNTLKIITLIHWHALMLYLKKVPYFKKTDRPHQQIGAQKWKN